MNSAQTNHIPQEAFGMHDGKKRKTVMKVNSVMA